MPPKLLIVETDTAICAQLHRVGAQDWEIVVVDDYAIALEVFRQERPALVILALEGRLHRRAYAAQRPYRVGPQGYAVLG